MRGYSKRCGNRPAEAPGSGGEADSKKLLTHIRFRIKYPDVRCDNCIINGCKTEKGCPIPPLSDDEARIMEMRGMLLSLQGLVDAGTVLRMHGATLNDLRILTNVENSLKEKEKDNKKGPVTYVVRRKPRK